MKKIFLQTQFGKPHPWTEEYFENVKMLADYGWHLKVFTPNPWKSSGNIEIVPMDIAGFDRLIEKHCGVNPENFLTPKGVPSKLVSDYYPAYGQIFQDYITGFDFWAHTNWDLVYGRLDHFVPDSLLESCDIWSDDVNTINGIFCLYRNNERINNLFRCVPQWEYCFTSHDPMGFDEVRMTSVVRDASEMGLLRFKYPPYFAYHSYDRLIQHTPEPNIYFESDGALIERLEDSSAAALRGYEPFAKGHFGREIMSFHFIKTKRWPASLKMRQAA